ncbi:MAG: phytoene/squalene synthase family protein [Betaproteobacteria bacterium]|nr:phytoene/squalene synthase family protein [Betaproteobacteria bacterium]
MPPHSAEYNAQDLQACVAMMKGGSKTFFAASRLLPVRVRAAAIALYAFCRVADDLVDQGGDAQANVSILCQRLDLIYAGTPTDAVEDHALALVVQHHQLPRVFLDALVEGFEWDTQARAYDTLEQLHDYAARVAGTVGAMMCWIMGRQSSTTLARACELGVAMQLTNIARDVGEDARNGRVYLPTRWLTEAGLTVDQLLRQSDATPGVKAVVGRLLDEADRLYKRSYAGIAELPADCRAAILAAGLIYAEIGHQLRREGLDSVSRRTVVSTRRKLMLLVSAWTQAGWIYVDPQPQPPLQAIEFLTRPVKLQDQDAWGASNFPNRAVPQRIEWVLGLFERLENERRGKKPASQAS